MKTLKEHHRGGEVFEEVDHQTSTQNKSPTKGKYFPIPNNYWCFSLALQVFPALRYWSLWLIVFGYCKLSKTEVGKAWDWSYSTCDLPPATQKASWWSLSLPPSVSLGRHRHKMKCTTGYPIALVYCKAIENWKALEPPSNVRAIVSFERLGHVTIVVVQAVGLHMLCEALCATQSCSQSPCRTSTAAGEPGN